MRIYSQEEIRDKKLKEALLEAKRFVEAPIVVDKYTLNKLRLSFINQYGLEEYYKIQEKYHV